MRSHSWLRSPIFIRIARRGRSSCLRPALRLANFTEMRLKQALSCRRPIEYSPQVQPMILTPGHGTLPMGHATETFMAALVLWNLLKQPTPPCGGTRRLMGHDRWGAQLLSLAARVAINRIVAGMHFPVDAAAGAVLGIDPWPVFREPLHQRKPITPPGSFDGTQYPDPTAGNPPPDDGDFYWTDLYDVATLSQTTAAGRRGVRQFGRSTEPFQP